MKKKKDHLSPGRSPFRRGKDEKENRTLSRARKTLAGQGPSSSSSPLKGEGKIGEGTEAHRVRVPLEEVPGGSWKIKRMPADLKQKLDKLLSDGTFHSCRQLAKWLGDNGFEISHAAIHKYGQKFERRLDAVRMATEQARIVCEQYKGDDTQMQSALMRLVQTQLFEVLTASNEMGQGTAKEDGGATVATVAPVNITALARSVSGLARAETEHRRWAERARAGVAEAEKKVDEAQAKGLSKDAAAQIKAVLLEI
jgi:Protein of unknown function (DUF3486)